jgi:hypothetical protein
VLAPHRLHCARRPRRRRRRRCRHGADSPARSWRARTCDFVLDEGWSHGDNKVPVLLLL